MLTKDRAKARARQIMGHSDRATTVELTDCGAQSGDAETVASTDPAHASASDSNWTTKLWLSLFLMAFVAVSLIGLRLGFGSHGDSRAIFENSVPAILHGHYTPGRSLGNPLYEAVASVLYPLGGLTLVNIYSLLLSLASIAVFLRQLKVQGSPAIWAVAGFVFNPIFLIQAKSPTVLCGKTPMKRDCGSAPEAGTVALFRGVFETWRTSWRTIRFHYGAGAWLLSILRPLRVLAYREAHRKLLALPVYKQFGATMLREDPFHHISHGRYLRQGLTVRQRVQYVYQHYAFESRQWTDDYRRAVYGGPGLELWRSDGGAAVFTIRLEAGRRDAPEGDLSIILSLGNAALHRINFSWLADTQDGTVTPFLASSQTGPRSSNTEALFAFERDFPQNSPAFFCFAAVEGVARVVGCTAILAVRSHEQICARKGRDTAHFKSSYDNFWRALGGWDCGRQGFLVPLPAHEKPLSKLSRSHRRRARKRRGHWKAIEAATLETLEPFLSGISSSATEGHSAESSCSDRHGRPRS